MSRDNKKKMSILITDVTLLILTLLISLLVDANGRIMNINSELSTIIAAVIITCGILVNTTFLFVDRKSWYIAAAIFVFYILLLFPIEHFWLKS